MKWPINFSFIFSNVYFLNLETLSCDVKIENLPLVKWSPPGSSCRRREREERHYVYSICLSSNVYVRHDILDHVKFCTPHGRLLCYYGKPLGVAELDIMHFRSSLRVVLAQIHHRFGFLCNG